MQTFRLSKREIIRPLMCVYFCGGTCIEDLSKHIISCVSQHPKLRTCSSDTILRAIEELTEGNVSYTSDNGKTYEFNKAEKLNNLLLEALLTTGQSTILPRSGRLWISITGEEARRESSMK